MGARDREFRMDVHTLLYSKWITKKKKKDNQQGPTVETGNSAQG